ncbi:unnamed protein product, partial [Owenia fusiformis]
MDRGSFSYSWSVCTLFNLAFVGYFTSVTSQTCPNVGTKWKTITSPGWPDPYTPGSSCVWRQVAVIPGLSSFSTTLRITIKHWDVNPGDVIDIYDGYYCGFFSTLIRTIRVDFKTGDKFRDNIFINGHEACLEFFRDNNVRDNRAKGFQIEAKALQKCGGILKDVSGEIVSVRYPRAKDSSRCQWKILSGKPGQRVKLFFEDIGMQISSKGCTIDYLRVGHGDLATDAGIRQEDICDMAQTDSGSIITDSYFVTLLYSKTQGTITKGFWLKFEVIGCPIADAPRVENVISTFKGNLSAFYDFGFNVTLTCQSNFTSSAGTGNNVTVSCLGDRTWSLSDTCVEIKCDKLKSPDDGNVTFTSGVSLGSVATLSCNDGYTLEGSNTRTCVQNGIQGTWTGIQAKCLKQCPSLNNAVIRNGVLSTNSRTEGALVRLNCSKGFFVNGTSTIQCLSNGTWDANLGSCEAISCPILNISRIGRVSNLNTSVGTEVELNCDDGYFVNGTSFVMCLSNGTWNGRLGICEEITCPTLEKPNNGILSSFNNSIGAEVELICDEGFDVNGSSILTCLSNGTWNDTLFGKCTEITCPTLEKPNNGTLSSVNNSIGAEVELVCDEGFYVNGSSILTCLSNGTWNDTLFGKCTEITCPTLEKPNNG